MNIGPCKKFVTATICSFALCSFTVPATIVEVTGKRPERDEWAIREFFNALEQQLLAGQMRELERSMRVEPTDVASAEPQAQCSKGGSNTSSSVLARSLDANEAALAYMSARRAAGYRGSFSGTRIRIVYGNGSSEVWTITSPGNRDTVIDSNPVPGTQLPASGNMVDTCRAAA